MWKIIDQLYLGDSRDAEDLAWLVGNGVTHIVNCTSGLPCSYPDDFEYLQLVVSTYDFAAQIDPLCRFIDAGRAAGGVMVHCNQARQRGPAAVIAYLCHRGYSLDDAVGLIRLATQDRPSGFSPPPSELLRPIRERFGA